MLSLVTNLYFVAFWINIYRKVAFDCSLLQDAVEFKPFAEVSFVDLDFGRGQKFRSFGFLGPYFIMTVFFKQFNRAALVIDLPKCGTDPLNLVHGVD